MILEKETFEKFGYYPGDLKSKSQKRIIVQCDDCGEIREIGAHQYRPFCRSCAFKGVKNHFYRKKHTKITKQKISNANASIKPEDKDILSKIYQEEEFTLAEIGKIFHTSKTAVFRALRRFEIPIKQKFTQRHKKKMGKVMKKRIAENGHPRGMLGKHHSEEYKKKRLGIGAGQNNPNWKGGISFKPYCYKFNDNLKERVRDFFNRRCYVCDMSEEANGQRLTVHHVNYDKMICCNDIPPLFAPLCKRHNSMGNFNREEWQEFFEVSLQYLTQGKCFYTEEEYSIIKGIKKDA